MTAQHRIPLSKPSITAKEIAYVNDAVSHGWGEQCYEYIHRFEKAFAAHLNVRHAIATSSCTGALTMGMAAMGIGPGDEVILADANWIASVAPVMHLGATPVLVDIREDTWCIDPTQARKAITPRTKAIVAVHLYGNLCHMDELLSLGREYGIPIIEDSAEAIGSIYQCHRAGSLGKFGCFSFHGSKTITTGEGGMFVTNDDDLYENVLTLSNHGRSRNQSKQFWPDVLGYKFKMSNIQAALGYGQLERVDELTCRRREILHQYQSNLIKNSNIRMNLELPGTHIGAWMPTITLPENSISGKLLIQHLQSKNIDARTFFHPISKLSFIKSDRENKKSYDISHRSINLPSYHDITTEEIAYVTESIQEVICTRST